MALFGAPKSVIGLDIGASAVKVVQMKKGPSGPEIIGFGMTPLPPEGTVVEGAIGDPGTVAAAIKEVLSTINAKGAPVYACISGQNVISRFIYLPLMSDAELSNTIKYEAEQYVPYAIDDVSISFAKLAEVENDGANQNFILLVVAQKELISSYMTTYMEAGIQPEELDVDQFATINALRETIPETDSIAIIDIGAASTSINILKDGILHFTRNIPIAGNNITMVIQSVLKLDFEQAENIKKEEGLIVMEEEENEVSEVVRTIIEELSSEIRRSFDYFKAQHRESNITKIILSGGTSRLKNLDIFLANELGVEVELGDPLQGLEIAIEDQETLYEHLMELTVGIGLALKGVVD